METDSNKKYPKSRLILPALILTLVAGSFFVGVAVGSEQKEVDSITIGNLENRDPEEGIEKIDFQPFWKTWKTLEDNHIRGGEVDPQEMVWHAIEGLARSYGDPHTIFMPPKETDKFETEISGQFGGVGMEIGLRDEVLTVIAPLKGTPAEEAGIESGDKILEINDEDTRDMNVNTAVDLIRGEKGTDVVLTLYREGETEPFKLSITRGIIDIPTIDTELTDDNIFIIRLFNFAGQSMSMFKSAMLEFKDSGADRLVLDLRNNPGGYLQASVEVASYFLPAGEIVLKEKFSDRREARVYRSKGYNGLNGGKSIVVLVNQGSASASEIVAGALGDHKVATIIGMQTFGKGSVQDVITITPDTSLKVTIAEWLTPDGHSFEGVGIKPSIEVEVTREDIEAGIDPQMERAVEFLLSGN